MQAWELNPEQAAAHPQKNIITRAIGADEDIKVDIFTVDIAESMTLVLCSDGLTNEVSDPEICYEIVNNVTTEDMCKGLVAIANKRGGRDNITVVIAQL